MSGDVKLCWICSSGKHVDNHHYDCMKGQLSPETVPLCRRCHVTYHVWGVGAFSPDTTEKALEVENKRREILRSLPSDHPEYRRGKLLNILSPLKLEDVSRSRYWYKKWGITPPVRERVKAGAVARVPFKIPNGIPLCGNEWLYNHLHDYTPEEIGTLGIEVACGSRWLQLVSVADKKGTLKRILRQVASE